MIGFIRRLIKDRRGSVLVIAAAAMPVAIGAAGLATDTIQFVLLKRQLQRAADSAAIAGAFERQNLAGSSTQALVEKAVNLDLKINQNTGLPLLTGYPDVDAEIPPNEDAFQEAIVKVDLAIEKSLPFSSLFLSKPVRIEATATAASLPGSDDYCVVALGKTEYVGVDVMGSSDLDLLNCGIMSNSTHVTDALHAGGNGKIKATVVAAKGGIQKSDNIDAEYNPSTSYFEDPFAYLEPDPAQMNCADVDLTDAMDDADPSRGLDPIIGENGTQANCFNSISVGSNNELQLNDNQTYYVNGGDVNIQGKISCTNCTIVLTNKDPDSSAIGNFKSNAKANIQISAPTAQGAAYRYIAIMQDRDATEADDITIQSSKNKINGGAGTGIHGVIYFPSQTLVYLGNSNTTAEQCTKIMGKKVGFTGNNNTKVNAGTCTGIPDWSSGRVIRLIA